MDRQIIYPGQVPLETDLLSTNKNVMVALGYLMQSLLGTSTLFQGLACAPTSPASMAVTVGQGSCYALENVDGTAYSSLAADTTDQIVKQGLNLGTQSFTLTAPATTGYSQVYLIEAAYQDSDATPVVLPYYNASNPTQAYSGPNNAGTAQNTVRKGLCAIQVKAGVAAPTGSQVAPAADTGYTGLYTVTVAQGQTTIVAGNIALASGAPFITETLTQKISQTTGDGRYLRIGQATTFTETSISTAQTLTAAQNGINYVATAALTLTINQTTTLATNWSNTVFAEGGAVTVAINAADKINGGTVGVGTVIPKGFFGSISTDAAGNLYVEMGWATNGNGSIASAATTDLGSVGYPNITITGSTNPTSFGSSAVAGQVFNVTFPAGLVLTYNATSTILTTGGANYTTQAGDTATVQALGGGNFRVAILPANGQPITPGAGVVATARNVKISVPAASATATVYFDEAACVAALGGNAVKAVGSGGLSLNLAATGIGGMDSGSAPVNGFVSIYAAKNLSTGTSGVFSCNVTTSSGSVYSGANAPAGYGNTCLIAILPTNGTGQIVAGYQIDRKWNYQSYKTGFTGITGSSTLTLQSLSGAVPAAARTVDLIFVNAGHAANFTVTADSSGTGVRCGQGYAGATGYTVEVPGVGLSSSAVTFLDTPMITPQTIYWADGTAATSDALYISAYGI